MGSMNKLLELFSGQGSISTAFKSQGWQVYRVDWSDKVEAEIHTDVSKLTIDDVLSICSGVPDVIWASPQCTTYSIATHRHRTLKEGLAPKTELAAHDDLVNVKMWRLIDDLVNLGTKYYFVENPRGRMRYMPFVEDRTRHTITYCSYGCESMKPTDIFTNHPNTKFKPQCKGATEVHKHADLSYNVKRDYLSRGEMPTSLCQHVAKMCEEI